MKKILSIILTFILVFSTAAFCLTAFAADEPAILAEGFCGAEGDGTNLRWKLAEDGTLTISGYGPMAHYGNYPHNSHNSTYLGFSPWVQWMDENESRMDLRVIIEDGVTSIGTEAFNFTFADCSAVFSDFIMPDSISSIAPFAFGYANLDEVTIPSDVTYLSRFAFYKCRVRRLNISRTMLSIDAQAFEMTSVGDIFFEGTEHEWRNVYWPGSFGEDSAPDFVHFLASGNIGGYGKLFGGNDNDGCWLLNENGRLDITNGCDNKKWVDYKDDITGIAFSRSLLTAPFSSLSSVYEFSCLDAVTDVYLDCGEGECPYFEEDLRTTYPGVQLHYNSHLVHCSYPFYGSERKNYVTPTCSEGGSFDITAVCVDCGNTYVDMHVELPAKNHDPRLVEEVPASSSAHGFTAGIFCVDCESWLSGHEVIHNTLGERTIVREATEIEDGEVSIICTVCGESQVYSYSYQAETEDPDDNEEPGTQPLSFIERIRKAIRGVIDWFLRLISWLGGK